ncbi:TlpA disulfide reductase family protein [Pseudalkalibacillus sp. SCS-8]|uniref:TlpA disulfide reductase family protein n=1 Tax=Pseudalkalibacillus nanhaiensis TaxID=3115291 RepID=UPI0032DACBEA
MSYFQIGSIIIRTEWIILFVAVILGFIAARYRLRTFAERKMLLDLLFNAFLIGLIVWKLSVFLFQPLAVIEYPMSLLYFTGGSKGVGLGLIVAILYLFYQTKKKQLDWFVVVDIALIGFLTSMVSIIFFTLVIGKDVSNMMLLFLLIGFISFIAIIFFKKGGAQAGKVFAILLVIGLAGWSVYDHVLQKDAEQVEAPDVENIPIGTSVGEKAPSFGLERLDGQEVELADYQGKVVVLNIWATWCPPCRAEMPEMVHFYEKYAEDNIEILAVNMTNSEKSAEDVANFKKDYKINFPILLDVNGEVATTYQAFTIPTTYVIDENGIIVEKIAGPMSFEWMENHILEYAFKK